MEQWEYLPTYLQAEARKKDIQEYLKRRFDLKRRPPRYMVESLMPELDRLGAEGWELVHMEPVAQVGSRGNVLFGVRYRWSNVYFCVFKRRKPMSQSDMPIAPKSVDEQATQTNPVTKPEDV